MRRVLLIVIGVLAALAVAGEAVLRIAPGLSPEERARSRIARLQPTRTDITRRIKVTQMAGPEQYRDDPYLGATAAPLEQESVTTPDYTWFRQNDSAGFPNRGPWPDSVDIAVLGSSLVMGPGVGIDSQFSTLLGRDLGGRSVLNFGVPGAGPELESRVFHRYGEMRRPRFVVLAIWLASDVDNAREFQHWLTEKPDSGFTSFRFHYGDTHPEVTNTGPVERVLNHSSLYRAVTLTATALLTRRHMAEVVPFPAGDTLFLSVRLQHTLAQGLDRGDTPNLRQVFFGPLMELQRKVETDGGRFVVVLLPSKEEIYGAEAFPAVLRTWREAKQELTTRGIPFIDLYPAFRLGKSEPPAFFPTDIHFTERGNRIIADSIAAWARAHEVFKGG